VEETTAPLVTGVMRRLVLLAASLRAGGVRVGVGELLAAHRALAAVDPRSRRGMYSTLRRTLCSRESDHEVFDAAFTTAFGAYDDETTRDAHAGRVRHQLGSRPARRRTHE
jgi:uncharacterized protein with von Willebrand factor type A (vWA) domain